MTKDELKMYANGAACDYLRRNGYEIIERNPTRQIGVVAFEVATETIVFFKIKLHRPTLRYYKVFTTEASFASFKRQCVSWRRVNKWQGNSRIDAINVYGDGECRPVVDHIRNIK